MTTIQSAVDRADAHSKSRWLHGLWIGLAAGFGGGLVSLGGGTLLIPLLTGVLGLSALQARGTSLAVAVVTATTATIIYAHEGSVVWDPVLWTGIPALVVAPVAARWSRAFPDRVLKPIFGLLVIAGGIALLAVGHDVPHGFALEWRDPFLMLVGVVAGTAAGLVGVSGGPILAPLFVLGLGMPQALAQGTSMFTRLPATFTGLAENMHQHTVQWRLILPLALGAVLGAVGGAHLALSLPEHILRSVFAVFLLVLGLRELLNRKHWRRQGGRRAR